MDRISVAFPLTSRRTRPTVCRVFGAMSSPGEDSILGEPGPISGVQNCGGSTLRLAKGRAVQTVEVGTFAYGPYAVMAKRHRQKCDGYSQPSSDGATVQCVGDCTTGEGYCYSDSDGYCHNCRLYSTATPPDDGHLL